MENLLKTTELLFEKDDAVIAKEFIDLIRKAIELHGEDCSLWFEYSYSSHIVRLVIR